MSPRTAKHCVRPEIEGLAHNWSVPRLLACGLAENGHGLPNMDNSKNGKKMHILIADDDPIARMKLAERLEQWGCQVTAVGDGPSATRAMGAYPEIDLAILNWMMPGLDGMLVAKALKDAAPHAQTLVMVGSRFRDQVEAAFPSWVDGYVGKPLDFRALKGLLIQMTATGKVPLA